MTTTIQALAQAHIPQILAACTDWHELAQHGPPYWRPRSQAELERKLAASAGPQLATEYNFVLTEGSAVDVQAAAGINRESQLDARTAGYADLPSEGPKTPRLVGECSLHTIDWRNRVAQVGVCIWNPNDRHHGYGQLAMKFLTEWSAKQLGLQRLEAWILANNVASQQLATRFGFEYEGRLRGRYQLNGERHDVVILGWMVS